MGTIAKVFFSASRLGFFSPSTHEELPDDAVAVSAARHAALLAGQAEGYQIVPDKRGRPQLRKAGAATLDEARAACVHAIKREAARRIEARMPLWKQLNAIRDNRDPGFHEIDAIRTASNAIEAMLSDLSTVSDVLNFPVADHPCWPIFDA